MSPKISIITAVFNRVDKIEQSILSVVNQTYDNIEYIIIDGGSTDGTVDIIKKYKNRISYWISEPDNGLYNALNKGIKVATGEYIQVIGSDDCLYDVHTIEHVVKELCDRPDVFACGVYNINPINAIEIFKDNHDIRNKKQTTGNMSHHPGIFVKRELYIQYPFDEKYTIAADYKCFMQWYIRDDVRFKYSDLPVVYFEIGGCSTDGVFRNRLLQENINICDELGLPRYSDRCQIQNDSLFKHIIKSILEFVGIFNSVRDFLNLYVRKTWRKHHCEWEHCRWCGR